MLICLQEMLDGLIGYNMDYHFISSIYVLRPWRIFFRLWIIVNHKVKCNRVGRKSYTSKHISLSYLFKKLNLIIIGKIKQMKFDSSDAQQLTVTGT